MRKTTTLLATAALAAGLAAACGGEPAPTEALTAADGGLEARAASAAELQDLAAARAATAPFHRLAAARSAGYDFVFLDACLEDPAAGGMGYHWVDGDLLDGTLDVTRPEALMYEPGPNGQMRLVGLEYVIPAAAWTSPNPPELLGRQLTLNAFDLWALHVWVWKNNPSGIYADWNPTVSCANAAATAKGGHH